MSSHEARMKELGEITEKANANVRAYYWVFFYKGLISICPLRSRVSSNNIHLRKKRWNLLISVWLWVVPKGNIYPTLTTSSHLKPQLKYQPPCLRKPRGYKLKGVHLKCTIEGGTRDGTLPSRKKWNLSSQEVMWSTATTVIGGWEVIKNIKDIQCDKNQVTF
jgi:hypothetical protein